MVVDTLTLSSGWLTLSLDTPTRIISTWPDPAERRPTATVGGDYALSSVPDDADEEVRWWAELARHARERWAKENPF